MYFVCGQTRSGRSDNHAIAFAASLRSGFADAFVAMQRGVRQRRDSGTMHDRRQRARR
ncbi:hypothetical protein BURKHO8Y_70031 [Burkholderia sp. 8Y]|nr:hypothetical protein BURKHO8Y_70031 [Burkholderia sp. 8Y]